MSRHRNMATAITAIVAGMVLVPATLNVFADNEGCLEDQKNVITQYPCDKDPKSCPQDDTIETTVMLGVDGGVIIVNGSGSVSFTYKVGGCDPAVLPADRRYEGNCDPESSDEFGSGSSSSVNKLREVSCAGKYKLYSCKTSTAPKDFALPNRIIDLLNATVVGNPFKYGMLISLPVAKCVADAEVNELICGGGTNTTKKRSDSTCFP